MTDPETIQSPACVNKTELATILRTSLPTLDKMLREHGDRFPVLRRGTNGLEYQFAPAAVIAFLRDLENARLAAGRARDELMQQYTLPCVTPPEEDGLTPRDLLQLAKLRQLEREEQKQAGFLVETAAVRAAFVTALTTLRRDMATAVRQTLRDANTPESVIRTIEARIADHQRATVAALKTFLRETPEHTPDGDSPALI